MKSLATCLNKMVNDGYAEDFAITDEGLKSLNKDRVYKPEQIKVTNFFRFEGISDPDDMSILYVIETDDGTKGTLIDSYGTYSDHDIAKFMKDVESIQKKVVKN